MPLKVQEQTIGGTQYRVSQLGGDVASDLLFRLLKAIGAGISKDTVFTMMAQAAKALDMADFHAFRDAFWQSTTILVEDKAKKTGINARWLSSSTVSFGDHFRGRPAAMLGWFRWCFEVNFGGFFAEVLGPGDQATEPGAQTESSDSGSPEPSAGSSGG
jgi:hypothetical protein